MKDHFIFYIDPLLALATSSSFFGEVVLRCASLRGESLEFFSEGDGV